MGHARGARQTPIGRAPLPAAATARDAPQPKANARPRVRLDRETILLAADQIVSREGLDALTMRRIGSELGADPTAVYRHFRNKDALLVELAERLFDSGPQPAPADDWREALRKELRASLARYRVHPDLAMLLARQPDHTPSLTRINDRVLGILARAGLEREDAARMFHVSENFVVGSGLYCSLLEHADDPRLHDRAGMRRAYALLPADELPHAVRAAPALFPDYDTIFDDGVELLIGAIERLAAGGTA